MNDIEIAEGIWARHESLMRALPPRARDEFLATALVNPTTAEKDRYWLMRYVEDLEAEREELLADLVGEDW